MARPDTAVIIGTRCRTNTALVGSLTNRPSGVRLPSASPVRSAGTVSRMRSGCGPAVQSDQAQARASDAYAREGQDDDEAPADALHAGERPCARLVWRSV